MAETTLPAQEQSDAGAPVDLEKRFGDWGAKEFGIDTPAKPAESAPEQKPVESEQAKPGEESPATETNPEGKPDDNPESPSISSLQELAKFNEVPFEQMLELAVPVKVDGKESTIPLKDVLKSYQLESHVNNKSMEVSNRLKELEAQTNNFVQTRQAEVQRLQNLGGLANQMLFSKYQNVDWNALRANDPVEYAAAWANFQQEKGQVDAYMAQLGQLQQQQLQQASQAMQARLVSERQTLINARPEWSNPEAWAKDAKAITQSLSAVGFTPEEIGSITDHRIVLAAHKAALYDALQAKKPEITQRLRTAPKLVTAGARTSQAKPDKFAQAKARLRENPYDRDSQASAFSEYAERAGLL